MTEPCEHHYTAAIQALVLNSQEAIKGAPLMVACAAGKAALSDDLLVDVL